MPFPRRNSYRRLIVFSRFPEPGRTKTRLIPALGPERAARLQYRLLARLLREAERVLPGKNVVVSFQGGTVKGMKALFGKQWSFARQGKGELGEKMLGAIRTALKKGARQVLLCGSDCPGLTSEIIEQGFALLGHRDLVLGPARDGGYYLVGAGRELNLQRLQPLFQDIDWGTDLVLAQTRQKAAALGLRIGLTPVLQDIDRPKDLEILPGDCWRDEPPLISLVLPTLNEEQFLPATLNSLRSGNNVEIIVADGGSRDRTTEIAESFGAKLIHSGPGRGRQMNLGAARAEGEILVFVHADTRLPFLYDCALRRSMASGAIGGAFEFALDKPFPGSTMVTRMVGLRSRYLKTPYGDQAYFVRAEDFAVLGGFPEIPILEDVHFWRTLTTRGRVRIIGLPAVTSGRRWREIGVLKTTFINQLIMSGDRLGISPWKLVKLYHRK
ncbi:MAG: TIGR04283 family arsenosugar biosynthesis glycosyltransferase [Desulfohalobiaceae bacterium]|nr:TIGR04283 family arsenosugar biosynthesis glycosyltransferase [Desulfohalobiaceae bacterium]